MKRIMVVLLAVVQGTCGPRNQMTGMYADRMGAIQYSFISRDDVNVSVMGIETELKYEREGNQVRILSPQGNQVLEVQRDGSLEGPLGMKLTRQQ